MKAMIFAAGLGTRLRPLTNDRPKAMVEVEGKPLLEHAIRRLADAGFRDIVVNVHHYADMIIGFLDAKDRFGLHIQISDERDELLETGGGLLKATPMLKGGDPILVMNVDVLTDLDPAALVAAHRAGEALATLAVRDRQTSRYLLFDAAGRLRGWRNVQSGETRLTTEQSDDLTPLAFSGIQVISPEFLELITERGKFSVIEPYLRLSAQHLIRAYRHDEGEWLDVGKPESLQKAAALLSRIEGKAQEEKK